MPLPNNFLQWDPPCNNQDNDATFAADAQRSGGATDPSLFASALANKAFYQWSTMVAALAAMLEAKGFSPNDGSGNPATALVNLQTVLANIFTTADLPYPVAQTPVLNTNPFTVNAATEAYQLITSTFFPGTSSLPAVGKTWKVSLNGWVTPANSSTQVVLTINFRGPNVVDVGPFTQTVVLGNSHLWAWKFEGTITYMGGQNYLVDGLSILTDTLVPSGAGTVVLQFYPVTISFGAIPLAGYDVIAQFNSSSTYNAAAILRQIVQSLT